MPRSVCDWRHRGGTLRATYIISTRSVQVDWSEHSRTEDYKEANRLYVQLKAEGRWVRVKHVNVADSGEVVTSHTVLNSAVVFPSEE